MFRVFSQAGLTKDVPAAVDLARVTSSRSRAIEEGIVADQTAVIFGILRGNLILFSHCFSLYNEREGNTEKIDAETIARTARTGRQAIEKKMRLTLHTIHNSLYTRHARYKATSVTQSTELILLFTHGHLIVCSLLALE